MKKVAAILVAATLGLISLEVGTKAAESSRKLSGSQIRKKLAGMQVTDEVHWCDVYNRDGALRSYSDGKGRVGIWAVNKDGLCIHFKEPDDGCYEISLAGDRIEMKPTGLGLSIEGILQAPTDRN